MVLVDTSVWIDHLHKSATSLVNLLERDEVLTHPFVIGELACGAIRNRNEILRLLAALPPAVIATEIEVLDLIERERLMGKGVGYTDVHLLASAMLTEDTQLWTADKRLQDLAQKLNVSSRF